MSYPRLVLDRDNAEGVHQLLLCVVPFVADRRAPERSNRVGVHDTLPRCPALSVGYVLELVEVGVTGPLHERRNSVHRPLEGFLFPAVAAGRAVPDPCPALIVD